MDFLEFLSNRFSIRAYKSDPVEHEKLQAILEAARLAPTGSNIQPFGLIVIHTHGREQELAEIFIQPWIVQAPIVFCICGIPALIRRKLENPRDYMDVDVGIIADHIILTAANLGLGTCMIGWFIPANARRVLNIPDGVEPILFITLGYADNGTKPKARKPLSELVKYEYWE